MRYGEGHKAQTRERILEHAGALLRTAGLSGLAVGKAMKAAGLTVGGFYNHFENQQRFVAATLRHALVQSRTRLMASPLYGQPFLEAFVRKYLSRSHRDVEAAGCPLPATLSELPQAGIPAREALEEELELMLRDLTERLPDEDPAVRRQQALGVFALCVGGLTLARALGSGPLSDEMLRACRRQLIPSL